MGLMAVYQKKSPFEEGIKRCSEEQSELLCRENEGLLRPVLTRQGHESFHDPGCAPPKM
jgi:hypothetical protein